jgi:hypothetical protein
MFVGVAVCSSRPRQVCDGAVCSLAQRYVCCGNGMFVGATVCSLPQRYVGCRSVLPDKSPQDGVRHIVIKLPYKLVKRRQDIRPMMLEKVMERLDKVG